MKKLFFAALLFCIAAGAQAQNARILGIGDWQGGYTAPIVTYHDSFGRFVMPNAGIPLDGKGMFISSEIFRNARTFKEQGKLSDCWVSIKVDSLGYYAITDIFLDPNATTATTQK